eukprot:g10359.t1
MYFIDGVRDQRHGAQVLRRGTFICSRSSVFIKEEYAIILFMRQKKLVLVALLLLISLGWWRKQLILPDRAARQRDRKHIEAAGLQRVVQESLHRTRVCASSSFRTGIVPMIVPAEGGDLLRVKMLIPRMRLHPPIDVPLVESDLHAIWPRAADRAHVAKEANCGAVCIS